MNRKFTRTPICVIALVCLFLNASMAEEDKEFPLNLLFSNEDLPKIRETVQLPMFEEYWESLLDADFEKDGNFLREAFLYVVTNDPQHGANARQGMLTTLEKETWDMFIDDKDRPLGMLWAGRLTAWMSLGYDWIYDLLSPEEREQVLDQIAEKGCVPCYRTLYGMRYPETVGLWSFDPEYTNHYEVPDMTRWPVILGHNNFRMVNSGGFALGMFALEGRDDRFDKWYEMLMDSFKRAAALYGSDGSYDEGINYCNFATTYLVYFMEVMKRKRGIDLFDEINWLGVMDSSLALTFPHYLDPMGSVNFGDASTTMSTANIFWVAGKSRDGGTQYQGLNLPQRHDLLSPLFYDATVEAVAPDEDSYFKRLENGWIVTRTGYEMEDLVVAMRSGPPANHEHADRNSVILKYEGEILLSDSRRPTYNAKSEGWLLRTSPAHNTILIDGKGHQYHNGEEGTNASLASAHITRMGDRPGYVFWASDATQAYALVNEDVESVTRTVLVFEDMPALLVLDKVSLKKPSKVSARWFVENRDEEGGVEPDGSSFTLTRPKARFYGQYGGGVALDLDSRNFPVDESIGIFPFVEVSNSRKSKETLLLMAGCPLKDSEANPEIEIEQVGEDYEISIHKGSQSLKVRVLDRGETPEFELLELKY